MDQYYSRVCGYKLSFEPWNDKFDQRTYLKYCNGAETFYSYDPQRRRLQNLVVNAKAGTIIDNAYTYDAVSNVLSVKNGASVPQSGKAGGQMAHAYTYDALYRLVSATGTYTGADNKTASYTLAMGYDNMHRITSKRQILTQNNVQFDGSLNVGYDLTYTYGTDAGKKFQLANVKDVNYRTEETPSESENVNNSHAYEYDANGNLVYVNTSRTKKDGIADEKAAERKLKWDEENRLLASYDNGFVTNYWYDADGERTVKTSGESDQVYVNSEFAGGRTNTAKFSLYVSPYLVANQGGRYTKHIYIGSQRVVSKIGDFDSYGSDPRRIQYAGSETDGLSVDYKVKYTQQLQAIKDNYATFAVPYNGEDNNDYVDGKGFCCNDGSLEAAQTRALARAAKNNFQEGDAYEKMQFYYHPDHLGSSSYITNLEGEVVQHIEYVPFGEVFVEERNNIWNTPYLFNAKEFDEETGLYYYGARYYDPRVSLWISTDPKATDAADWTPYRFGFNNPIRYTDPDGRWEWDAAGNLKAQKGENSYSLAKFFGTSQKNAMTILNRGGVTSNDKGVLNLKAGQVLSKNDLWVGFKSKSGAVVNNSKEAVSHYFKGKGASADVGDQSTRELLSSKKFQEKHAKITSENVASEGYFSVDLTKSTFHIGRTNVDYRISGNGKSSSVTYILFSRDGFWDPDFIGENTLGKIPVIRDWTKAKPDGPGPNLERGGTPYHYKTRERTYFLNLLKTKNNLIGLSIGWQPKAASLNSTIFNGLFYERCNEI